MTERTITGRLRPLPEPQSIPNYFQQREAAARVRERIASGDLVLLGTNFADIERTIFEAMRRTGTEVVIIDLEDKPPTFDLRAAFDDLGEASRKALVALDGTSRVFRGVARALCPSKGRRRYVRRCKAAARRQRS